MAPLIQTGLVFSVHYAVASEFVNAAVHLFSLPVHPSSSVATTSSPQTPIRLSLVSRPSLNLLFYIGGLSLLVFGSPAKSLRLQVCHIFCCLCWKPLHSFLASGFVNTWTIRFNSISRFQQHTARIFRTLYTCLSFCSMPFRLSASLQVFNSIRNAHQPFAFSSFVASAKKDKPLVSPFQFHRQQKNAPNLCAYCIGRSLAFLSSAISTSTFAQLADGSRTSLSSFRYHYIPFVPFTSQTPVAPP